MFRWRDDPFIYLLGWIALVLFFVLLVFDSIGFRYLAYILVTILRGNL